MVEGDSRATTGRPRRSRSAPANFGPLSDGERADAARRPASSASRGSSRPPAARAGETLEAEEAEALGLVTFALDDIDWEDEIRIFLEERASFSPDALTGMEANLRFAGPETMETKIFGRLTAWQNWIFQRPNAVGARARCAATAPAGDDRSVRP